MPDPCGYFLVVGLAEGVKWPIIGGGSAQVGGHKVENLGLQPPGKGLRIGPKVAGGGSNNAGVLAGR